MKQYIIITLDNKIKAIESSIKAIEHYANTCKYIHWDTDVCGELPKLWNQTINNLFYDTRDYTLQRECAYRMEADPLYIKYRASSDRDNVDDPILKQLWLDKCNEIKAKYPKPE